MQAYLTVSDIPGNCGDVGVYAGSDNGVTGPKKNVRPEYPGEIK
jgi:hypothetical protein